MEQNFSRKKGTLSVYRLNYDGTEGAYELQFDLNAAYDEKGNLNKNAAVDANMKVAETLQAFLAGTNRQCRHVQGCIRRLLTVILDGLHGSIQSWLALHHHSGQVRYFPDQIAKDKIADGIFQHDGKGDSILRDGVDLADDCLDEADEEEHNHELHTKSEDR